MNSIQWCNSIYRAKLYKTQNCEKWLVTSLRWQYNEHDSVSNHQPHDCLLNRLFGHRSKKISKLRVTGLCEGNSWVVGELPAQRASNADNDSIWWRHHVGGLYQARYFVAAYLKIPVTNSRRSVCVREEHRLFISRAWTRIRIRAWISNYTHLKEWDLTHWGLRKMAAISRTIFSSAFPWTQTFEFQITFHWILYQKDYKPLSESMLICCTDRYMRHSVSMSYQSTRALTSWGGLGGIIRWNQGID